MPMQRCFRNFLPRLMITLEVCFIIKREGRLLNRWVDSPKPTQTGNVPSSTITTNEYPIDNNDAPPILLESDDEGEKHEIEARYAFIFPLCFSFIPVIKNWDKLEHHKAHRTMIMMCVPSPKIDLLFVYATSAIVHGVVKTTRHSTTKWSSPKNVSHLHDHRVLLLIVGTERAMVVSALDALPTESSKHLAAARITRVVVQVLKMISLHDDGYLDPRVYLL